VSELVARLPALAAAHLQLSLAALALGGAVSLPLGVWLTRRPRLAPGVLAAAGVVQTIPSLALLAFMVPVLAALGGLTARALGFEIGAIGRTPALVALTLYAMLPMLQNTVAGLEGVDPALREAARSVGMTDAQQLRRVELPLALPVVVAGVRTSAVWVVGTATLATPVGAPSLGDYIFSGLQTRNYASVTVGCAAAAGLALVLDTAIRAVESGLRRRRRRHALAGGAILAGLAAFAAGALAWERARAPAGALAIGAKPFTEQYVLAEILGDWLGREEGVPTRTLASLGSTVLFDALRAGEIDVYVDYSGTLWATVLGGQGAPPARQALRAEVQGGLARHGIEVAAALGFENTYALAMRAAHARELGVTSVGALARHAPRLAFGSDYEFLARPEWRALRAAYGLAFRSERSMDPSLLYAAVAAREVDVISAYSTDGRIAALDLRVLEDERGVIPPYDALVLVRSALVRERPALGARLARLEGALDADTMQRLNLAVDRDGRHPAEVARAWVDERVRREGR
jgi:osmoprotectant transport system permease protein